MMVPVQEDERLFAQHNEDCVAELRQLGEHKKLWCGDSEQAAKE
jgi:hypothetical protein